MKVHPINQIYIENTLCKRENVSKSNVKINALKDSAVLNYMNAIGNYNISFCATKEPFYAVDENGNYKKYTGRKEAADDIKTNGSSITQCLSEKRRKAGGYFFFWASQIETTNENGNKIVDTEKLNAKLKKLTDTSTINRGQKAVYAINEKGEFTRYESLRLAAEGVGGSDSNISKCLKGEQSTAYGYGYLYADEVEKVGEDGKITLNRSKIRKKQKQIQEAISAHPIIRPFYAVDKDGNYTKFERNKDASQTLGIFHSAITKCLAGERDTANGYAFVFADEVEEIDENGNTIINIDIPDEIYDQRTPIPVYSIDKNGKKKRFDSIGEAATKLNISRRNIDNCLKGERETVRGYGFLKAEDVEIQMDDEIVLDSLKFNEKFQQVIKNALYVVDKDGHFRRYNSGADAARELGVTEPMVIFCANGIVNSVKGKSVIKASYVEKYDKGRVIFNQSFIKKLADDLAKKVDRPIIAIDTENKKRRYKNKLTASKALGVRSDKIQRCLNGEQKTSGGYKFVYEDVEEKRQRKAGPIYVLDRAGDVHEYESIPAAAKAIGVEVEEIEIFLKKGRTKDKQTTLNGYVFATADDE